MLGISGKRRVQIHPVHKRLVEIADHAAHRIAAEAERVAADEPEDGGDAHGNETLDHDPEDVSLPRETAVEERKAGRHEHDEAGGQKHETSSASVEHKRGVLGCDGYNGSDF